MKLKVNDVVKMKDGSHGTREFLVISDTNDESTHAMVQTPILRGSTIVWTTTLVDIANIIKVK